MTRPIAHLLISLLIGSYQIRRTKLAAGEVKAPIDCICILDTSGSMNGSKIEDLKKALNFVVGVLSE